MIITKYQNGNCKVEIHNDGTKIREWSGVPAPQFPESIDLKITDYCDAGCPYCHEKSTKKGKHASIQQILRIVDGLPPGIEIAIGGGNPLDHPNLEDLLIEFKSRGLIANLTINELHFIGALRLLHGLQTFGLLHGIGISIKDCSDADGIIQIADRMPNNIVWHLIAGITKPQSILRYYKKLDKILVLGYKQYGRGIKFYDAKVEHCLGQWRYWIGSILKKVNHVSFDSLAIQQLNIQDLVSPTQWKECYMGNDGQFTMYIDAVQNEYAISSVSERKPLKEKNAIEAFRTVVNGI